jgi:hypothetical protein
MKHLLNIFLLAVVSLLAPATSAAQTTPEPTTTEPTTTAERAGVTTLEEALATITESDCFDNVMILAARGMAGRGTMTEGFGRAASFVESQLEALGYKPAQGESFRIPVTLSCIVGGEECSFLISGLKEGEAKPELEIEKDFVPVLGSPELMARGEPVFIGYAINSKKEKWVDLKEKSVRGKVVFAFTREPQADDPKAKTFDGTDPTRYSSVQMKAKEVLDAGGIGLVLVPDPGILEQEDRPMPGMVPYVDSRGSGPSLMKSPQLKLHEIPVMSVSRAVASRIFDTDITAYYHSMNKKKKPKTLTAAKGVEVLLGVQWAAKNRETFNLAALLPAAESNGEVLVLGAHLDHVGFDVVQDGLSMVLRPGADDNASGSGALLEVAQALSGTRPQIDILFLWFTGEELGLLGSRDYCEHPIFPHKNTVAMFNMDMVGRTDAKKINIGGLWDLPTWTKLIKSLHQRIGSRLKMDNQQGRDLYARSDQYSFHQAGVVSLFFFEADLEGNKVYHQPGDVPETIDGAKMSEIAKLFTALVWAVAYEGERP